MFTFLGRSAARRPLLYLAFWSLVLAGVWLAAPRFRDVAEDKGFGFLPADAPSRQAHKMFEQAFPDDRFNSNVVLIVRRNSDETTIAQVKQFVEDYIEPGLRQIAKEEGGLATEEIVVEDPATDEASPARRSIIARIRTPNAPGTGALLVSEDDRAALVLVELTTDLLTRRNAPTIRRIEKLMAGLETENRLPAGCELNLTGSAVIGRDYLQAQKKSASATEFWTVVLVVVLLVVIYRAPLVALIPLATVVLSVQIALKLLALLAEAGYIHLFEGIQTFITVLTYGAGVDYCLFLTARYKEELEAGRDVSTAVAETLDKVGVALVASAGTVMGGIAMLSFARFGKFHEAGVVIPIALFIVLAATLTFAPALLRLTGRWAFWPYVDAPKESIDHESTQHWLWRKMGQVLLVRPGMVWLTSVLLMLPFAAAGVMLSRHLTYDMVSNLPDESPSVAGTRTLQDHFPAGVMGPIAVLLINPQADFASKQGRNQVAQLTDAIKARADELDLVDLRSLATPLGITPAARRALDSSDLPRPALEKGIRRDAIDHYTSDLGERRTVGSRLDIVLRDNPFSRTAIDNLFRVESAVAEALPGELQHDTQIYFTGATPSIRDLRDVTMQDQVRVEALVLVSVLVILLMLLRQGVVCFYLLLSVLFSYYTALGVTFALFWALNPAEFAGLDWKVTMFLFTILIAVGEDYNIFLMTRIREEQQAHGLTAGMMRALARTGPIISSCGIIMAGTFASLMAGSLTEMKQLGFALAFGVLLDTFVVRPILVPAFLLMFQNDRLSPKKWLHLRQPTGSTHTPFRSV